MLFKPKMTVYVLLLAAAIAAMVALRHCDGAGQRPIPSDRGDTLYVAIEYGPMSLYMYDDTLGGFNHDLLGLIAKREGIVVTFKPVVSIDESLERLNNGEYDIVAAQMPATAEFKDKYLFSEPVFIDKHVLVQRRGDAGKTGVSTQLDLGGKTVCVAKGSPVVSRIYSLSREIGDSIYVKELDCSNEQLFLLVASGAEQLAAVDEQTARRLSSAYPNVDSGTAVSFNQFHSWILRKGNEPLRDSLDKYLLDIKQTPAYKELHDRYFEGAETFSK